MSTLLGYRRIATGIDPPYDHARLYEHAQARAQESADSDRAHALRDNRAASSASNWWAPATLTLRTLPAAKRWASVSS